MKRRERKMGCDGNCQNCPCGLICDTTIYGGGE
jgi:hypothetical protein